MGLSKVGKISMQSLRRRRVSSTGILIRWGKQMVVNDIAERVEHRVPKLLKPLVQETRRKVNFVVAFTDYLFRGN